MRLEFKINQRRHRESLDFDVIVNSVGQVSFVIVHLMFVSIINAKMVQNALEWMITTSVVVLKVSLEIFSRALHEYLEKYKERRKICKILLFATPKTLPVPFG